MMIVRSESAQFVGIYFLIWFYSGRLVVLSKCWFAISYVGWDIYDARHVEPGDNTNHSAHLSGAFLGATFGLFYRLRLTEREAGKRKAC